MSKKVNKYRVRASYICSVYKEVYAEDEWDAVNKAEDTFEGVIEYINDTIGVEGEGESIEADGEPMFSTEWIEVLEEDVEDPDAVYDEDDDEEEEDE